MLAVFLGRFTVQKASMKGGQNSLRLKLKDFLGSFTVKESGMKGEILKIYVKILFKQCFSVRSQNYMMYCKYMIIADSIIRHRQVYNVGIKYEGGKSKIYVRKLFKQGYSVRKK
jgi:hypothetical protein